VLKMPLNPNHPSIHPYSNNITYCKNGTLNLTHLTCYCER